MVGYLLSLCFVDSPSSPPTPETPSKNENGSVAVEDKADKAGVEMITDIASDPQEKRPPEAESPNITVLRGHTAQVFVGAWNPILPNMLATGYALGSFERNLSSLLGR